MNRRISERPTRRVCLIVIYWRFTIYRHWRCSPGPCRARRHRGVSIGYRRSSRVSWRRYHKEISLQFAWCCRHRLHHWRAWYYTRQCSAISRRSRCLWLRHRSRPLSSRLAGGATMRDFTRSRRSWAQLCDSNCFHASRRDGCNALDLLARRLGKRIGYCSPSPHRRVSARTRVQ